MNGIRERRRRISAAAERSARTVRAGNDSDLGKVVRDLYKFFAEKKMYSVEVFPDFKENRVVLLVDGDWKHDHLYVDHLMQDMGYTLVSEKSVGSSGDDCYESEHTYDLPKPEEATASARRSVAGARRAHAAAEDSYLGQCELLGSLISAVYSKVRENLASLVGGQIDNLVKNVVNDADRLSKQILGENPKFLEYNPEFREDVSEGIKNLAVNEILYKAVGLMGDKEREGYDERVRNGMTKLDKVRSKLAAKGYPN